MFNLKLMTDANNNPISTDNETDFKMKLRSQCTGDCCTAGTGLQHIRHREKKFSSKANTQKTISEKLKKLQTKSPVLLQDYNHNICQKSDSIKTTSASNGVDKQADNFDLTIHQRYLDYINLCLEKKDISKTDYTYAHSFSYSSFVSFKDRFNWIIPNMSRASLNHLRSALLDKESVSRTVSDDLPYSQIKTFTEKKIQTRGKKHLLKTFQVDDDMHSTPIKQSENIKTQSKIEYSDDDEDEHNQTVQMAYSRQTQSRPVNGTYDLSDDEDDDELTIIRRITRVVRRTFNVFLPPNNENTANSSYVPTTSVPLRRNIHYRPKLSHNEKKSNLWFWLPFFLITSLSSTFIYLYYFNGALKVSSLLDFSKSSPSYAERFLPYIGSFRSSFSGDDVKSLDTNRINYEIKLLRNEIQSLKSKQESRQSHQDVKQPLPPSSDALKLDQLFERLNKLEIEVKNCCQSNRFEINQNELHTIVVNEMGLFQQKYDQKMENEIEKLKKHLIDFVAIQTANITKVSSEESNNTSMVDVAYINKLIKNAISKYDADKTGETDFALESSGAQIISTRCSETFEMSPATYKIFGITVWRSSNLPRVVIQSGVVPGDCWCFKGSEGRIAILLSVRIIPSAFTYEHIPVQLSRDGHIMSAPAKFSVYGLKSDYDQDPELLGEYYYELNGETLQRFPVQNVENSLHTFDRIELVVKSNHNHPEYTCLYRLRVHGTPVPSGQN